MKNMTTDFTIPSKEKIFIDDCDASFPMMGFSFQDHREKNTIRLSIKILDIQIVNDTVVSDKNAMIHIKELDAYRGIHLKNDSPSALFVGKTL